MAQANIEKVRWLTDLKQVATTNQTGEGYEFAALQKEIEFQAVYKKESIQGS